MLVDTPLFKTVALSLIEEVSKIVCPQDCIVFLAHNKAKFDIPIIRKAFTNSEINIPANWHFADSLSLFKGILPR
jgi:hypothetical protein